MKDVLILQEDLRMMGCYLDLDECIQLVAQKKSIEDIIDDYDMADDLPW